MNLRSLSIFAAFALCGVHVWRWMKIGELVRRGWPRWAAAIEVDFDMCADCAEPEKWPG